MKKLFKLFALAIVLFSFTATTFAQGVTATASATATIITPITITKTIDMNFGNVAVNATAGTVVLTPASTRTVTGGCTLPGAIGTVKAASFDITGLGSSTFSVTLPSASLTITDGTHNMTVDTWTSTPTPTGVLASGTATLLVGATLNVALSQVAGVYTGTPFTVTVNYN